MKILITGATGFIGSAFLRMASASGHEVAGLIRDSTIPETGASRITWLRGPLGAPPWREIISFKPDVCVHSAWIATPGVYLESAENELWVRWSLDFLQRLMDSGIKHIVTLGTCIEYEITGTRLTEDGTPIAPRSLYARCKNELRRGLEEAKVPLCWGRVFYPYGPGEHPARLPTSIIDTLSRNEKVILKTPGSTKDYIFIDDLAAAILAVIEQRFLGTINLGTGSGVEIRQIAQSIAGQLGKTGLIEETTSAAADPLGYVVADATRLRSLGWSPRHTLEDGLKKLIASVRSTRDI